MLSMSFAGFFEKFFFQLKNLSGTLLDCQTVDPDPDRRSVGPELVPNSLQIVSSAL